MGFTEQTAAFNAKKKISVVIGCFNEEANVCPLTEELVQMFQNDLPQYDYEIIFIDNYSTDNTRILLRELCKKNKNVKAIFNVRNFGATNSGFYGIMQATGDCVIAMAADFQTPTNMIPQFIKEWENGYKIVCAIKTKSKESFTMWLIRSIYYKLIRKMSDVEQIEHFTGFGLYDKSFIEVMRNLKDTRPYTRGIVAELGFKRKDIEFEQPERRAGTSYYNLFRYYDEAMLGFTSYTKTGLRIATIIGFMLGIVSILVAVGYFVYKLVLWDSFTVGIAPLVIGMFFLGAVQIFFLGFIGEYIMSINARIMNRPLVIEEERLNF